MQWLVPSTQQSSSFVWFGRPRRSGTQRKWPDDMSCIPPWSIVGYGNIGAMVKMPLPEMADESNDIAALARSTRHRFGKSSVKMNV